VRQFLLYKLVCLIEVLVKLQLPLHTVELLWVYLLIGSDFDEIEQPFIPTLLSKTQLLFNSFGIQTALSITDWGVRR